MRRLTLGLTRPSFINTHIALTNPHIYTWRAHLTREKSICVESNEPRVKGKLIFIEIVRAFCSHFYIFLYAFDGCWNIMIPFYKILISKRVKKNIKTQKERLLFFCSFLWKLLI